MLNLDTDTVMDTDMAVLLVTTVAVLLTLDVPSGVWVNDQLMPNLRLRLKLMLNLDIMDMDTDTVAMEVMDMVVDTVMVMDTVTMARFFQKIAYSCCSYRNQKCLHKIHKIE